MSHVPKFHRLAVNDPAPRIIRRVSLTFAIPEALADDYSFAPGQYLTLRTMMDGEEVRRSIDLLRPRRWRIADRGEKSRWRRVLELGRHALKAGDDSTS